MYKSILIIGSDHNIPEDIRQLYSQEGYFLIGNGKDKLSELDLKGLQDKIGPNTRIDIWAHGKAQDGQHQVDGAPTNDFLAKIAGYSNGQAMHVHMHSCFSGAASRDVSQLPVGSALVCHSENKISVVDINRKTILQSNQDLSAIAAVEDFSRRFLLNVKQTVTLSIRADNGHFFEYAIRIPNHLLSEPAEIIRYFDEERNKFLGAYNEFIGNHRPMPSLDRIPIYTMPKLTEEDAIEWKIDNFLYLALTGDAKLSEITIHPENFADCVHSILSNGRTALLVAAYMGHAEAIRALVNIPGIDLNITDINHFSALMAAAYGGHAEAIRALAPIPDINSNLVDIEDGMTALMLAAHMGHAEAIRALAPIPGIDSNLVNINGMTALMLAAQSGHAEAIRALAHIPGIDPNLVDINGMTALMLAAQSGHAEAIRALAPIPGIDPNLVDINGMTALMFAAHGGHAEDIRALAHIPGIDPNFELGYGTRALSLATHSGNVEAIKALVSFPGLNLGLTETPLMVAAHMNNAEAIRALAHIPGIDPNLKLEDGTTALIIATHTGHIECVRALILNFEDIDFNMKLADGRQIFPNAEIRYMLQAYHTSPSRWLLDNNADADRLAKSILTVIPPTRKELQEILTRVVSDGNPLIIEQLLDNTSGSVSIDFVDKDGRTLLMHAAMMGRGDIMEQLRKAGADINLVDKDGKTALDYARKMPEANLQESKEPENAEPVVLTPLASPVQSLSWQQKSRQIQSPPASPRRNFGPIEDKEEVSDAKRKLSEAKKILKTVSDSLNSAYDAKRDEVNNLYERNRGNKPTLPPGLSHQERLAAQTRPTLPPREL